MQILREGNYPNDKGECKTQDVKDCDIHEENQNKCKWCADGKYLKTDDYTCQTQDAPGCKFHIRNENKCGGAQKITKKRQWRMRAERPPLQGARQ